MRTWRAVIAGTLAVVATVTVSGCGGGGGGGSDDKPSSTAAQPSATSAGAAAPSASATATVVLAQLKGEAGMVVTINSAVRDAGGFATVEGTITNDGDTIFNASSWAGQELAVQKSGASMAGAVLVDEAGKKRYYVLRDTEGKCLCTMGLILIKPQETRPFFAQFPAPPAATTQVDFELPTMPPAKITLSEG
jgi:hypothetical protein